MTIWGPRTLVSSFCDIDFFQFAAGPFVPIWTSLQEWQGIHAFIEHYVALCTHLYLKWYMASLVDNGSQKHTCYVEIKLCAHK